MQGGTEIRLLAVLAIGIASTGAVAERQPDTAIADSGVAAGAAGLTSSQSADVSGVSNRESVDEQSLPGEIAAEARKGLPDFSRLDDLLARAHAAGDSALAACTALVSRARDRVSAEIGEAIEDALRRGDADGAEKKITYCDESRKFLGIPMSLIVSWQQKTASLTKAEQARELIESNIDQAARFLGENAIGQARDHLSLSRRALDEIRAGLPPERRNAYTLRLRSADSTLAWKEDSLVNGCLRLVELSGRTAAVDCRQQLLTRNRVAVEKMARVDDLIARIDDRAKAQADSIERERGAARERELKNRLRDSSEAARLRDTLPADTAAYEALIDEARALYDKKEAAMNFDFVPITLFPFSYAEQKMPQGPVIYVRSEQSVLRTGVDKSNGEHVQVGTVLVPKSAPASSRTYRLLYFYKNPITNEWIEEREPFVVQMNLASDSQ